MLHSVEKYKKHEYKPRKLPSSSGTIFLRKAWWITKTYTACTTEHTINLVWDKVWNCDLMFFFHFSEQ